MTLHLTFLGGVGTVTGSKYLLEAGGRRVLIDCGLFQGYKQLRQRNWAPPPFAPENLDAVILTHAHLDHSGYIPLLVRNGFAGPVYATLATHDLCAVLLPDSGHLQERDAKFANRRGYSRHRPAKPLYTWTTRNFPSTGTATLAAGSTSASFPPGLSSARRRHARRGDVRRRQDGPDSRGRNPGSGRSGKPPAAAANLHHPWRARGVRRPAAPGSQGLALVPQRAGVSRPRRITLNGRREKRSEGDREGRRNRIRRASGGSASTRIRKQSSISTASAACRAIGRRRSSSPSPPPAALPCPRHRRAPLPRRPAPPTPWRRWRRSISTSPPCAGWSSGRAAAGATDLVLDLPIGPTAKVRSAADADSLGFHLLNVARALGLNARIVRSDGRQPVGRGIGPALEARDVLAVLQNAPAAPADLRTRALTLAGALLELGGAAAADAGMAEATLASGRAWTKFQGICDAQGGMRTPASSSHRRGP